MMFNEKEKKLLKEAFDLYNREYLESIPPQEKLKKITFSDEFEKRMDKLIKRERKPYYSMINTAGKRVASIVVVILACLTVMTVSVKAIREPVVSFITSILPGNKTEAFVFVKTEPAYIPKGFVISDQITVEGVFYRCVYENTIEESRADNLIIYYDQIYNNGSPVIARAEDIEYTKIKVNESDGLLYSSMGKRTLIFSNENYIFTIQAALSQEEIIKMAESIEIE